MERVRDHHARGCRTQPAHCAHDGRLVTLFHSRGLGGHCEAERRRRPHAHECINVARAAATLSAAALAAAPTRLAPLHRGAHLGALGAERRAERMVRQPIGRQIEQRMRGALAVARREGDDRMARTIMVRLGQVDEPCERTRCRWRRLNAPVEHVPGTRALAALALIRAFDEARGRSRAGAVLASAVLASRAARAARDGAARAHLEAPGPALVLQLRELERSSPRDRGLRAREMEPELGCICPPLPSARDGALVQHEAGDGLRLAAHLPTCLVERVEQRARAASRRDRAEMDPQVGKRAASALRVRAVPELPRAARAHEASQTKLEPIGEACGHVSIELAREIAQREAQRGG